MSSGSDSDNCGNYSYLANPAKISSIYNYKKIIQEKDNKIEYLEKINQQLENMNKKLNNIIDKSLTVIYLFLFLMFSILFYQFYML
jgi:hypothetical protein